MLNFIDENAKKPFFVMWTTTVPHSAVQAPADEVMYYVNKLGDEKPTKGEGYFPNRYPHATYAAMVTHIDTQVGKLVEELKRLGVYENTIIIVTSDNGPACNSNSPMEYFESAKPFKCSKGWGKSSLHEGGVRMPFIVSWAGHLEKTVSDRIGSFTDVMPTLADVAGVKAKKVPQNDGISFSPMLKGKTAEGHEWLYWEFPGSKGWVGVRLGNWKGLLKQVKKGNDKFELYDLSTDPRESKNVAAEHPEIIEQMWKIAYGQHTVPANPNFRLDIKFPDSVKE
jgi:arylsulfatase